MAGTETLPYFRATDSSFLCIPKSRHAWIRTTNQARLTLLPLPCHLFSHSSLLPYCLALLRALCVSVVSPPFALPLSPPACSAGR